MKEENEKVVEEITQEVVEKTTNEPKGDVAKVKETMTVKPKVIEETITKVDLSKPPAEEVTEAVDTPQEEIKEKTEVLEEVTNEAKEEPTETVEAVEVAKESIESNKPMPENIEKLISFIEETGGDINDYVKLSQDYDEMDNQDLLIEFYKQTKPHLDTEEINFLMEDQFSFDEDADDDREIKKKKIALKEQVASAKSHLDGQKSKYYDEIKSGSKLTDEQQKAINFFDRYKKEEAEGKEGTEKRINVFNKETKKVFNDKFKGFEYNVGDKKYRYNVQDADKVQETQSDISNFIGKFLDENNTMKDAEGYHKSLFTANNADAIAKHFYEQGKSDAIKTSVEKGKNISMDPRQAHGEISTGGLKVRALGDSTADFKFKIKNNKFKN